MAANSEPEVQPWKGLFPSFSLSSVLSGPESQPPSTTTATPPPCLELLLTERSPCTNFTMESIHFDGGFTLFKGRVSTQDVFSFSNSDLVPGKYEGGLKLWEGSLDLVKQLHLQIQEGQLSLRGKRVLELGCGHGLPGIFMCLEGASAVHFQDFNAEVLRCLTIPNVRANIEKESHGALEMNKVERNIPAEVRFFSGDWSEVHQILPHVCGTEYHNSSGSSSEQDACAGYDIILMAETVYSISSLRSLYELTKKCLSRPHGVIYMAAKKHYFGVGGGTRQFLSMVENDGVMDASLTAEVVDGSSNVREVWKFSFK
ncbi:hypothetical protein IFM89_020170 [Coptis chinensis]|uniref:protein-histidine N-methyltransferase n=1 Tax=Coptis chinensis TaxID=261450 RepID=A0A835H5P8_9MAGN|nr:hypothetical protein IFM89_020170 [Coptis chinensis]